MGDMWKNHPEMGEHEILLTNTPDGNGHWIGWKTKRLGDVAYDIDGNVVDGLRPVFVERQEIKAAGENPDMIGLSSMHTRDFDDSRYV